MDSIRYRFITIILATALLMGFGALKAKAANYFPLQVGNSWTYSPSYGSEGDRIDTIIGKEEVNGTLTYIWNRQEAPDDNYNEKRWLAKDDTFLRCYKLWGNEGAMDSPVTPITPWIIPLNPVVGDTWEFEIGTKAIYYKSTSYVESTTESVTVATGTFHNCIIVRKFSERTEGGVTEYKYKKIWYAPGVGPIIYRSYHENWNGFYFSQELVSFSISSIDRVSISGDITTQDGTPVCAMVLANGQYMFSCNPTGKYNLDVPLDENGQVTLFAFADGFAPLKYIFTPEGATDIDIMMLPAPPDSPQMTLTCQFDDTVENPGWVRISGQARAEDGGTPLCAMVLANGQHMFSNAGNGEYELEVPLDENGEVTLFGFADGFQPFKEVLNR